LTFCTCETRGKSYRYSGITYKPLTSELEAREVDIKEKWDGWYYGRLDHVCPPHDFNECGEGDQGVHLAGAAAGRSLGVAPQASIVGVKVVREADNQAVVDLGVLIQGMTF